MKKLLSEIITAWWIEVDTKLVNPKSEEAISGLKKVLREDFKFDSDVIDYVVEMVRSTPTNFHLGGKTSGIDVGKNQTAVSAQLHPNWDDDEEEDDEDDVYNNNDGELSEWDVTLLDGLDELNEDTWVKNQKGNIYAVKNFDPKSHTKLTDDEIEAYKKSKKDKGEPIEDDPSDGEEESGEEETQQQQPDNGKPEFSDSDKVGMMTQTEKEKVAKTDEKQPSGRPEIPSNSDELISNDHQITDEQLNMTKQQAAAQAKQTGDKGVGAGTAESRAGEAMVHKGLRLLQSGKTIDELKSEFTSLVNSKNHILNSPSGKKWVDSTISSITKIDEVIGIDNIQSVSWDTPQGRTAIGVDTNLETSSDMFVRTKDGETVGISLKKDGNVFLNNGGWDKQSKIILDGLKDSVTTGDYKRLKSAMSIDAYKDDLRNRFIKTTDTITPDDIAKSFERLKNEPEVPKIFAGSSKDDYFKILENPSQLIDRVKSGKISTNEMKSYAKILQLYHTDEYNYLRESDNALTKRAFDAINASQSAKDGMKKHIIKSMHISETVGINQRIKNGGVDKFITTYGIKPDGAILDETTLNTLLGSKFRNKLNETISEVRNGEATTDDLDKVISDSIEIDYESGKILFKHENNKKYPLFYMAGRTRGIGSSPVMELAQTPLMAHALKQGTFNTDEWDSKSLKRFKDDIKDIE
jgi:hypothetical protein